MVEGELAVFQLQDAAGISGSSKRLDLLLDDITDDSSSDFTVTALRSQPGINYTCF